MKGLRRTPPSNVRIGPREPLRVWPRVTGLSPCPPLLPLSPYNVHADSADKNLLTTMKEHARNRRNQSDREKIPTYARPPPPTTRQALANLAAGPAPRLALEEQERTVSCEVTRGCRLVFEYFDGYSFPGKRAVGFRWGGFDLEPCLQYGRLETSPTRRVF